MKNCRNLSWEVAKGLEKKDSFISNQGKNSDDHFPKLNNNRF